VSSTVFRSFRPKAEIFAKRMRGSAHDSEEPYPRGDVRAVSKLGLLQNHPTPRFESPQRLIKPYVECHFVRCHFGICLQESFSPTWRTKSVRPHDGEQFMQKVCLLLINHQKS
jgi:hypothetical protein